MTIDNRYAMAAGLTPDNSACSIFRFVSSTAKTIGIIGYGTLGSAVGRMAAAFGMRVLAARRPFDPTDQTAATSTAEPARVGLGKLLTEAHIISLHCPLTAQTENLVDHRVLGQMREDAILINTARGGLVDSAALIAALRSGAIGGAGIDVLRNEPPAPGEPLTEHQLPNLLVTPHVAWAARESRQRAIDQMAVVVAGFLAGAPVNEVQAGTEKAP